LHPLAALPIVPAQPEWEPERPASPALVDAPLAV